MKLGHALESIKGFPSGAVVNNLPANAGDTRDIGLIPGLGRSPGGGHSNPLKYSCLENPMDRGAWLDCKESDATEHTQSLQNLLIIIYSRFSFLHTRCIILESQASFTR